MALAGTTERRRRWLPRPASHAVTMARWIAAAGAFVVSLDSLLNIAFPALAVPFDAPPEAMRWVIVGYVLTYALMSLVGGTLGDVVGHGRVFQVGSVLGLASYLLCGLAPGSPLCWRGGSSRVWGADSYTVRRPGL
jgi:MFS family permease